MAQEWAEKLMAEGKFEHRKDKKGKGENIAHCGVGGGSEDFDEV